MIYIPRRLHHHHPGAQLRNDEPALGMTKKIAARL